MAGQGVLPLEGFTIPTGRTALLAGVQRTLEALAAEHRIRPEHAGMVELARFAAERAEQSGGIASTNYTKLAAEVLDRLLLLEPPVEEVAADDAGNRVTQLTSYLHERRAALAAADVPHAQET